MIITTANAVSCESGRIVLRFKWALLLAIGLASFSFTASAGAAKSLTVTAKVPPAATTVVDVGVSVATQVTPACVTVTVLPAMVSVAERLDEVVLATTLSETVPLPLPEAPALTVSHDALLAAVHPHPVVPVTDTEKVPAPDVIDCVVDDTL